MNEQVGHFSKEIETIFFRKMQILVLKNTTSEIKNSLDVFNRRWERTG